MPEWNIPSNLSELIDSDPGNTWESHEWAPIVLTVLGGTVFQGRPIPLSWQIEFEPAKADNKQSSTAMTKLGLDSDGYGWSDFIQRDFAARHPNDISKLHTGDTEQGTCVIWVESEMTCRLLMETAWGLVQE